MAQFNVAVIHKVMFRVKAMVSVTVRDRVTGGTSFYNILHNQYLLSVTS